MWTLDPDVRLRYVRGMTRLSVWYVHALLGRGEIRPQEIADALCQRVNLYRLTDLWNDAEAAADGRDDVAWRSLTEEMASWIQGADDLAISAVEDRAVALLDPLLWARVPKEVGPPPVRPFECWTYELGWAGLGSGPGLLGRLTNTEHLASLVRKRVGLAERPSQHAVLHFMNVRMPASPLEDTARLASTLQSLMADVRERQPQVRQLWCNTWLNDHPKFRTLFPEAWFRSATVAPPGHFRNWWGQFARRDGDFNTKAAQRFRESGGVFAYRALQCHASLESIEEHLRQFS